MKESAITLPYIPTEEFSEILTIFQYILIFSGVSLVLFIDLLVAVIGIHLIYVSNIIQDAIKYLNNIDLLENATRNLEEIFKLHCEIIEKINEFSNSVSLMFLSQISTTALMLITIFYIVQQFIFDYLTLLLIIAAVTFQLFITCFLGQIVEWKMEQIYDEFCQINWYDLSLVNKGKYLICLQMAQKCYGMKAGGMYNVNMMMFIQIIKLALTYAAIIQSVVL
ncbi:hypothetical protein DMENIID0001_012140 [Sergentomyia squamirostris]